MAAKRFGAVPTNVEGLANQILRVKSDESGFEFFTPASLPTYTVSNVVTDRSYDANDTTIDELADVVGTLIDDIDSVIGGSLAFQWSTSEQVYPFEKDAAGNTLYCKIIDVGALPNAGSKTVASGLTDVTKIFTWQGFALKSSAPGRQYQMPGGWESGGYAIAGGFNPDQFECGTAWDATGFTGKVYVKYSK